MQPRTQLHARGRHASHRQVGSVRILHAGEVDNRHHLERGERLPVASGGDARLEFEVLKLRAREVADQLGIGAFPHDQHIERVARGGKRGAEAAHQRHYGEQHRHRQGDAQSGHGGGGFAHQQVAKVIGDGNGHG
jgi:hypothetical protein